MMLIFVTSVSGYNQTLMSPWKGDVTSVLFTLCQFPYVVLIMPTVVYRRQVFLCSLNSLIQQQFANLGSDKG